MDMYKRILLGAFGLVICAYLASATQRKKQVRRYKVRPINRQRMVGGSFYYYQKMKKLDEPQFFKYTRMTHSVFQKLLTKVGPFIKKQKRKDGISPEERLVITLQ